jgi:AcrR family transcriptional regulator
MVGDTKERILEISLQMFAQRGFSAVSIRDICKQVGIKESSVYYHFENKQCIFDEIMDRFISSATSMMHTLEENVSGANGVKPEGLQAIGEYFFDKYLMDDFLNKVMRMMQIEQYGNEHVRELYLHWLIEEPVRFQSKVFSVLMEAGILPATDSKYCAVQFYGPILYYAHKWLFVGELDEDKKAAFLNDAYSHMQQFFMGGSHV